MFKKQNYPLAEIVVTSAKQSAHAKYEPALMQDPLWNAVEAARFYADEQTADPSRKNLRKQQEMVDKLAGLAYEAKAWDDIIALNDQGINLKPNEAIID